LPSWRWIPYLAVLFIGAWTLVGASSSGQWGDHFEQFVWAHGVEWGYYKHPPLPTWMLAGTIRLFGPTPDSALLLGALCSLGTALFTYRIAFELLGRPLAIVALLCWGLQQPFSNRAYLFNHNTVMMLAVSATAWCLLEALKTPTRFRWWGATGVLAGLAMLAKYQSVVPLVGLILATWLSGEFASRRSRLGLCGSIMLALAIFMPHVAWVFEHDLTTLAYADQGGRTLSWASRASGVASFLAQQVRLLLPALLFAGFLVALTRPTPAAEVLEAGHGRHNAGVWLFGLVGFPFLTTVVAPSLLGLALQNHWGYQALQFASLWLAWLMRGRGLPDGLGWLALPVLLHATFIGIALGPTGHNPGSREDANYPAQKLADAVRRDWQDDTSCPLAYVVGPSFEAGIVSVYNGGTAAVLEDGVYIKSPWIKPADIQLRGAAYLGNAPNQLPSEGVTRTGFLDVGSASPDPKQRVYWAIVPPLRCLPDGP
jgi:4-amino-4-deoxy-L-arabinose transferase-like glycosyltransferase